MVTFLRKLGMVCITTLLLEDKLPPSQTGWVSFFRPYTCGAYHDVQNMLFRSFPNVNRPIMLLAVTTVEINVSFHGYYVSLSILVIFRSDQTLLFVAEEPRPLHRFELLSPATPVFFLLNYQSIVDREGLQKIRALSALSVHIYYTFNIWMKVLPPRYRPIFIYIPRQYFQKKQNRHSEPWPSARIVELPIKVELISKHYKCFVITVILWKHIYWVGSQLLPIYMIAISWASCKSPRCQRWDSNPLNTNLWHMARAESIDLPWTFIQPWFSKPAVYLSRTLAYKKIL